MRYGIHLCYNGTNYAGWQIQPNALTVQEELEKALSTLLKEDIGLVGCGRTDTGVHANNFYAHFDTVKDFDIDEKTYQTNAIIGNDINIFKIFKVSTDWHARFSATERTYHYIFSLYKNPFLQNFSWHPPYELNYTTMDDIAKILIQYSDFTSFARLHGGQKNNLCEIRDIGFTQKDDTVVFEIRANRFLRNMVRAIVGTLIDVGRGKISKKQFCEIIEKKNRSFAGSSAPAKALFLHDVKYDKQLY